MKLSRTLTYWRFILFVFLIVAAPLSKYPSIAAPLFNFSSFRIGLYQIVAALFVVLCIKPIFTAGVTFFAKRQRLAFGAIVVLTILALTSIAWSLYPARSALLGVSFVLLTTLVLSVWWYVASQLNAVKWRTVVHAMLYASLFFGIASIIQLFVFTFTNQTLGVLCPGCSADIFGFPRINGFAAEPQFFANAMIPFVFASVYAIISRPSKIAWSAFVSSVLTIGLTFSRGAYVAIAFALIATLAILYYKKLINLTLLSKIVLLGFSTVVLSLSLLTASATLRYNDTPNITYETVDSIFEHLTLGIINLPEKTVLVTQSQVIATQQNDDFVSPGLIESSGNERLSAAELAIKAWQYHPLTIIFGVSIGNLGPFVVQNIDSTAPNNLTVYIYYVLLLSELGLIGIGMFSVVFGSALVRLLRQASVVSLCMAGGLLAFLLQFFFFGSYINVLYIWLWLGIALGIPKIIKTNQPKVKKV